MKKFLLIFVPIFCADTLTVVMGWLYGEMKEVWYISPLLLIIPLFAPSLFTGLLILLVNKIRPATNSTLLKWGIGLACIDLAMGILYYFYPIDWLAINENLKAMSLFEKIIHSDSMYYLRIALYPVLFLFSQCIINPYYRLISKNKRA